MSDPQSDHQSRPRDGDRKRAVERVDAAYAEGRITAADRALRVGNIESAETLGELDLVVRDLRSEREPPAQVGTPPGTPPAWTGARQTFRATRERRPGSAFQIAAIIVVCVMVVVSLAGSLLVAGIGGDTGSVETSGVDPFPIDGPYDDPIDDPTDMPVDKLALSEAGLRWFVGRYEDQFGTTRALRVVIREDRATVDLPVRGGRRHEMWRTPTASSRRTGRQPPTRRAPPWSTCAGFD